jgi:hypothetical protein
VTGDYSIDRANNPSCSMLAAICLTCFAVRIDGARLEVCRISVSDLKTDQGTASERCEAAVFLRPFFPVIF